MNPITQGVGWNQHDGHERRLWRGMGGRSDFRVSLSRTSAAPSTDQTTKTLAYLVPVGKGLILDLFDGEDWVPRRIKYDPDSTNQRDVVPTDLAVMTTTTVPYDLFVRWRGGRAETKLVAWASATARNGASIAAPWLHESGLGMHEGILCRTDGGAGAAAAGRLDPYWRYVSTIYPSASGQCEDSAAKRLVWNAYNQVSRPFKRIESTFTWTYGTSTWRQANASSANQVECVTGLTQFARPRLIVGSNDPSADSSAGIGVDSTTPHADCFMHYANAVGIPHVASLDHAALGYRAYKWCELRVSGGTAQFYGTTTYGGNTYAQCGLSGDVMA